MDEEPEPRFRRIGPCRTGITWLDMKTQRYLVYDVWEDPNVEQAKRTGDGLVDYKAGWHSR